MLLTQQQLTSWVEALRSGKFKQCGQAMESNGAYCCLGVLHITLYPNAFWRYLPVEEVNKRYSEIEGKLDVCPFIIMNDNEGKTFEEIADYIEVTYLKEQKT